MAAPAYQAVSNAAGHAATTGTVTVAWPSHLTNDVALLFVESQANAVTLSTSAGFVALGTAQAATGTRLSVFWCRATSGAMSSPVIAGNSDHTFAVMVTFRGCITTGNPFDAETGGVKSTASTSATIPAVTTTVDEAMIVMGITKDLDSAAAFASGHTNANLTSITERFDAGTTSGNGGGIAVFHGVKATAGTTGTTAVTVTSSTNAYKIISLRPPEPSISQDAFRFYEDGFEGTATAIANTNTNISRDVTSNSDLLVRFRAQETSSSSASSSDDYTINYSRNSSAYTILGAAATLTVCDSYATSNQNATQSFNSPYIADGQIFTGNGGQLDSAEFYLQKNGSPTGTAYAKIYAVTGTPGTNAIPTGTELAISQGLNPQVLGTTLTLQRFYFTGANRITLENGTAYAVVVELVGATTANGLRTGLDNTTPTHAGNNVYYNATGWVADSAYDAIFAVYTGDDVSVIPFASSSLTDDEATSRILGAGSGSFVPGKVSEDGEVNDFQITGSNHTEFLYSITLAASNLADTDTVDFRVYRNTKPITTYTVTPRVTVSKTGGGGGGADHNSLLLLAVG